jgi:hypothetical protein
MLDSMIESMIESIIESCTVEHGLHVDIHFLPIAVETLGTINSEASDFLVELGRRIAANS